MRTLWVKKVRNCPITGDGAMLKSSFGAKCLLRPFDSGPALELRDEGLSLEGIPRQ